MIITSLAQMEKNLKQIDPVYSNVTDYMSLKDRIKYCEQLITETEHFISSSERLIDERTRVKYEELISAASAEIETLKASDASG